MNTFDSHDHDKGYNDVEGPARVVDPLAGPNEKGSASIETSQLLSKVPSVSSILEHPSVKAILDGNAHMPGNLSGRRDVVNSVRKLLDDLRERIRTGRMPPDASREDLLGEILDRIEDMAERMSRPSLRRVINATGIVLHTNLGRAPLPRRALEAIVDMAGGYSNLEFDLNSGGRGSRQKSIASLISLVTGAESALVVNNNAAAVFLCLNTLASGRQVVVSRGQQVEIGGSFRIPDVIASSGAQMVEVGTTNKTHLRDYENAINEATAVILKIHTSNFKIIGFTSDVALDELVALGRAHGLIVMEDLGSGSIIDLRRMGLPYEPTVKDSLSAGADLVTFSGDKLLGGPQAGIIAGKKDLIEKISRNPLARAVRVDKMTLAALEAVFRIYRDPDDAFREIPVLRLLSRGIDELQEDAERLAALISGAVGRGWQVKVVDDTCEAGGGSLPGVQIPGRAVALVRTPLDAEPSDVELRAAGAGRPDDASRSGDAGNTATIERLQAALRRSSPPIVARIYKDQLLFNVRTLLPGDAELVAAAVSKLVREASTTNGPAAGVSTMKRPAAEAST